MAQMIPEDVLRNIASFLPYNERVEMNRALPLHYRFVKKINSDEHNAKYKQELLRNKLKKVYESEALTLDRVKHVKQLVLYLLHTRDTYLFIYPNLVNMMIQKSREFSTIANYGNLVITERRAVLSLVRAASQLLSKAECVKFPERKKPINPGYVQIL